MIQRKVEEQKQALEAEIMRLEEQQDIARQRARVPIQKLKITKPVSKKKKRELSNKKKEKKPKIKTLFSFFKKVPQS